MHVTTLVREEPSQNKNRESALFLLHIHTHLYETETKCILEHGLAAGELFSVFQILFSIQAFPQWRAKFYPLHSKLFLCSAYYILLLVFQWDKNSNNFSACQHLDYHKKKLHCKEPVCVIQKANQSIYNTLEIRSWQLGHCSTTTT